MRDGKKSIAPIETEEAINLRLIPITCTAHVRPSTDDSPFIHRHFKISLIISLFCVGSTLVLFVCHHFFSWFFIENSAIMWDWQPTETKRFRNVSVFSFCFHNNFRSMSHSLKSLRHKWQFQSNHSLDSPCTALSSFEAENKTIRTLRSHRKWRANPQQNEFNFILSMHSRMPLTLVCAFNRIQTMADGISWCNNNNNNHSHGRAHIHPQCNSTQIHCVIYGFTTPFFLRRRFCWFCCCCYCRRCCHKSLTICDNIRCEMKNQPNLLCARGTRISIEWHRNGQWSRQWNWKSVK